MEENKLPEQIFNKKELDIIKKYLEEKKSIREISQENEGFGRTKIRNIISRYCKEFPDEAEKIKQKMNENRYHKKEGESTELPDITEEQIAQAYEDIQNNGITLTSVSKSLGRTKDYVRKKILEFINDPEEEMEFKELLKTNQHRQRRKDFLQMSEQDKKDYIFKKLNRRRELNDRRQYEIPFLEKKYSRLKRYLLEIRNQNIPEEAKLSEDEFFKILYDTPTLLSSSLSERIIPALENLDYNESIGMKNATKIISEDASVLCSSIARTNLQIRILNDNDLLDICIQKPRNFRTSPEMMYALIEFNKSRKDKMETSPQVFITKSKLETKYGLTSESLIQRFDIKDTYGDDEYFSK